MAHVLVVEDERDLQKVLEYNLKIEAVLRRSKTRDRIETTRDVGCAETPDRTDS